MGAFGERSISMRLYPHNELTAAEIVREFRGQAALASAYGFDGVMNSEHHGGFSGYSPNPLQVAGWMLESMPSGWAAPCPMLLPIRPVALLAEEVAWLAARFPDRVGVGVAPGALPLDFEVMDLTLDDAMPRFRDGIGRLASMLRGEELGQLAGDRALQACADSPVPVISTAMSEPAVRRAARVGTGIVYDGGTALSRLADLTAAYRAADGTQPIVLIRRVWLGPPPREAFEAQQQVYAGYSPASAMAHWRDSGWVCHDEATALADELAEAWRASGATCVNLRVHVPGVSTQQAREQIIRLGSEVVPLLRDRMA